MQTSSSESTEPCIYGTVARRSTILSCPFNQYSRTPRLAKPVSIPIVPGMKLKNKKVAGEKEDTLNTDLDIDCVLSASLSISSTSLVAGQMSCSTICEGENRRFKARTGGSISLTPDMARKMMPGNTDDQKGKNN